MRAAARRRRGRRRRRWSAPARPGRRWRRRPSACAGCKGVQRPALAVQLPVPGKPVLFLDVGANVEVRAQHLVQFAFLGAAFSAAVLEVERPARRPALGRRGVRQGARGGRRGARAARRGAAGSSSPATSRAATCRPATADVVVTDGFTGNVALKLMEGTAKTVAGAIRDAARSNPLAALGGLLMRPALGGLRRELAPRHHRRRDPARPARDRRRRPRQLRRRGDRQRRPPRRPLRRGRRGRPHRGAAARGRRRPRRAGRRRDAETRDRKVGDEPRRSPHPGPRAPRRGARGRRRRRSARGPASRRTSTPTRSTSTSW